MKRYVTIDFFRGLALLLVCFMHMFSDAFDQETAFENINTLPLSLLLILFLIVYFGGWGGLFVMISATGNMFSMQLNRERGHSIKKIVLKQIFGGIFLLIISMIVEGTLQYYGYFGTLLFDSFTPDPTRIIWHAFTMTPVHCLSMCMIINGIIQGFLFMNEGHLKYRRNIIIYLILTVIVILVTQPLWNLARSLIPGYPNQDYPSTLGLPYDYDVMMPLMGQSFGTYCKYFGLMIVAGSTTPLFPFLISSFLGNINGLALLENRKKKSIKVCSYGMIGGILFILLGILVGIIIGAGFDEFFPLTNDFGDLTGLSDGLNYLWFPWFCFLTGGQLITIWILIRIIEYRGKTAHFAEKTKIIRRFGIPALTIYTFHRFVIYLPIALLSWITGYDFLSPLPFGPTLLYIGIGIGFVALLLWGWDKIGYIGSLEWGLGTIFGLLFPSILKAKANQEIQNKNKKIPWYLYGKIDVEKIFYHPDWIDIISPEEMEQRQNYDYQIILNASVIALLIVPMTLLIEIIAFRVAYYGLTDPRKRKIALIFTSIGIGIALIEIIVLTFLNLSTLGISF